MSGIQATGRRCAPPPSEVRHGFYRHFDRPGFGAGTALDAGHRSGGVWVQATIRYPIERHVVPRSSTVDSHQSERDRTIREAEYTLEYAARCPHCREEIELLHVARLLRTRVNFTSTLPRRGHVISCPQCHTIISADLLGFA